MTAAPLPHNEQQRLTALRACEILDTPPEAAFDRLTKIASEILNTPIALVSLVDAQRQWFKSRHGLAAEETPRESAFCAHTILNSDGALVVPDAVEDARFRDNPLVVGDPKIRFYAGASIITRDGHALGTVCAIDRRPRNDVSARDIVVLKQLAAIAADELELRLLARQLAAEIHRREMAESETVAAELGRARAEAEAVRQRAADSLARLTGGMAHEFNSLFAGLRLGLEQIRDTGNDNPTFHEDRAVMLRSIDRGARLTQGMLSYSGKETLAPKSLDLRDTLENAAEMMRLAHGAAAQIDVTVTPDCGLIAADKGKLLAVLAELVDNACAAAAPAPARITLSAANSQDSRGAVAEGGNRFACIAVADQGPGMAPDVQDRACEPFFTTKAAGAGPGLGLSMVLGFARQSGGFLTIQSQPGVGTIVALHLPRAPLSSGPPPRLDN